MMRRLRITGGIAAVVLTAACTPPPAVSPAPAAAYTVRLVDSLAWEPEGLPVPTLHRVEVRGAGAVHTIPGVWTYLPAVAVPGGVVGFAFDTAQQGITTAFRYDPRARTVRRLAIPPELRSGFADPAISPDGRHVAYAWVGREGTARAEVRPFPNGRVLVRGPEVSIPPTDALANGARWTAADAFEVWIDLVQSPPRYLRVRGTLSRGVVSADTVAAP